MIFHAQFKVLFLTLKVLNDLGPGDLKEYLFQHHPPYVLCSIWKTLSHPQPVGEIQWVEHWVEISKSNLRYDLIFDIKILAR